MYYNEIAGLKVSALGMGNMRLPVLGKPSEIDKEKAFEIIDLAYKSGVNYFDTAFMYHDGESEKFVGEALSRYPRESFFLASKMPGHMMLYENGKLGFQGYLNRLTYDNIADIFEEQLKKCRTDYFDFYLLHNLNESSFDFYTNEELGVVRYLKEQKEKGRIRHLGFSSHGRAETIGKFLDIYDCFEFVQIQLNYLDWSLQDAKSKYELLESRGIPVVVMEPVRGGGLAKMNEENTALLKNAKPDASLASWGFRFLMGLPNVSVVLSGMTELSQMEDNLSTFTSQNPLSEAEKELLNQVVKNLADQVPCTACRYCCDVCPQSLNIPKLISLYNEAKFSGFNPPIRAVMNPMTPDELPSACIACEACKNVCPQSIDVTGVMEKFAALIANPPSPRRG